MQKIDLDTDIAHERLSAWLTDRLDAGPVTVTAFTKPKSGFSAETSIVDVAVGAEARRLVLRREVPDPAVYPQQAPGLDVEIDIQYRAMQLLQRHASVPLAPLVGYEADETLLGAPFFVMGFIGGDVPTESPPYTAEGFFVDAAPAQRRAMIERGLGQVAAIHSLDWRAAGFEWLAPVGQAPGTAQQLELWRQYAQAELRGRTHPLMAGAFDWLAANVPADERLGLCWGDPRPGNIIWQDFAPACLTDFEAVSIGSPLQDLGWWLMFDRTMHPDGTRLDGDPTRAEQIAMYETASGRAATGIDYFEVFAAARYTAIVVRVMNRLVDRGDLDPNHTIWLENPATVALGEIMNEQALR
jgi:aminoglycoside phosphotransferase (APT) family kinase protein